MTDDVGITNVSAYSRGLMGYHNPNIDRIADEGALFTDYYGEQSCTAGRASFITGQNAFRVGMTKVGMPGAKQGLSEKDPTIFLGYRYLKIELNDDDGDLGVDVEVKGPLLGLGMRF